MNKNKPTRQGLGFLGRPWVIFVPPGSPWGTSEVLYKAPAPPFLGEKSHGIQPGHSPGEQDIVYSLIGRSRILHYGLN